MDRGEAKSIASEILTCDDPAQRRELADKLLDGCKVYIYDHGPREITGYWAPDAGGELSAYHDRSGCVWSWLCYCMPGDQQPPAELAKELARWYSR